MRLKKVNVYETFRVSKLFKMFTLRERIFIMEDVRSIGSVNIWEEKVVIPTYEIGEADKNPMFLEKRVYQGSSGKVYPYPTTEKISNEKKDKVYQAVYMENKYMKIMVLPELGGRIQRAYDKTNHYDFVYYNHVIKPALVGLIGPWISGGIEFNWPQHHRPTTFMPVDYQIRENGDGSKTLLVNDVDQMYGTKGIAGFTLYPDRAYIEISGQLYNRTPFPQTFLWWANPAVPVNEYTQSIFPPDVHSVMDHGKRDVSRFPIAKGIYYKHDYSEGVDISRYKNIPVPTSYMAEKSEYDFVGGYDFQKEAGILHIADHHISPGKKQWTWGCGEFGKAWDRNLTDEDGPYVELMTGVYTDNQPDFTWLKPFEEKTFKQYFMPYKKVGAVKNASIHAVLNVEQKEDGLLVSVYATKLYECAKIQVKQVGNMIYEEELTLSPEMIYEKVIPIMGSKFEDILVQVYAEKTLLVEYQKREEGIPELPKPAQAAEEPERILTNEELFLTGQHIEQYRHATYLPDSYYLEGLKRDSGDSRINNAYGLLLMRRGNFVEAEKYFRKALKRLVWKNPNPYNSEPYYNLGLTLFYQEKRKEAFDMFYKATWSNEQQEMSFYYLSVIKTGWKEYEEALEFVEKGLVKNMHNVKARGLKAVILRKLNRMDEAFEWLEENLNVDSFDYLSFFELAEINGKKEETLIKMNLLMRDFQESYLQVARDYAEAECYKEAVAILEECTKEYPLLHYYKAHYYSKIENMEKAKLEYKKAQNCNSDYCFPNKLEDIFVLQGAMCQNKTDAMAYYYLGNLYYDKLQFEKAIDLWETSVKLDDTFAITHRNLALAYYNKKSDSERARGELEKAFLLKQTDARIFLELDQLYKRLNMRFEERLEKFEKHKALVEERDDLFIEYITLHNLLGYHQRAYDLMMSHVFKPWEGAEGKITTQYKIALLEMAKEKIQEKSYKEAEKLLLDAQVYPENLGEGRLEGTKENHIYYYLGLVKKALKKEEEARECFYLAELGENEPAGAMYYNDQPADMILYKGLAKQELGKQKEASACFNKLMDYGEQHINDTMQIDYFAVSLPDFLIFEDDLNKRNKAHCYYLMGLSYLGIKEYEKAKEKFETALKFDFNHQNSRLYRKLAEERIEN